MEFTLVATLFQLSAPYWSELTYKRGAHKLNSASTPNPTPFSSPVGCQWCHFPEVICPLPPASICVWTRSNKHRTVSANSMADIRDSERSWYKKGFLLLLNQLTANNIAKTQHMLLKQGKKNWTAELTG